MQAWIDEKQAEAERYDAAADARRAAAEEAAAKEETRRQEYATKRTDAVSAWQEAQRGSRMRLYLRLEDFSSALSAAAAGPERERLHREWERVQTLQETVDDREARETERQERLAQERKEAEARADQREEEHQAHLARLDQLRKQASDGASSLFSASSGSIRSHFGSKDSSTSEPSRSFAFGR